MTEPFKAVLFDMDGTLVEPTIDFIALRERLGIPQGAEILATLDDRSEAERERDNRILDEIERDAAERTSLFEGARENLDWLAENGIRFGILTRNSRKAWAIIRKNCGLGGVEDVVTREDGIAKPEPESIRPFLDRWGCGAREMIHVGDYLFDLLLADRTGMHSILFNTKGTNPFEAPCDFIAPDHTALGNYLRTLPFSPDNGRPS